MLLLLITVVVDCDCLLPFADFTGYWLMCCAVACLCLSLLFVYCRRVWLCVAVSIAVFVARRCCLLLLFVVAVDCCCVLLYVAGWCWLFVFAGG